MRFVFYLVNVCSGVQYISERYRRSIKFFNDEVVIDSDNLVEIASGIAS